MAGRLRSKAPVLLLVLGLGVPLAGCPKKERSSALGDRSSPTSARTTGAPATAGRHVAAPAGSSDPGCRTDADCVATFSMGECCSTYCEGYPVSRWEQQRREAATANCGPGTECPPPAPCPERSYVVEAVCDAGRCVARKVPRGEASDRR